MGTYNRCRKLVDKRAAEAYGKKMMRKADSNMTKANAKASVDLMIWMLDQAAQ